MSSSMLEGHIFISYARKDGSPFASRLDEALPRQGFVTWRDKRGIDPSQDFTAEIEKAIEASSYLVTCITPDTRREDSFVRREITFAQILNKPIVVARFADVPPPIPVVTHTWIDFFEGWEPAFLNLVELLRRSPNTDSLSPIQDPHIEYLQTLYKQIVRYLDKTIFSVLPGQSNTTLITLEAEASENDVLPDASIDTQALPLAFFDMAGINEEGNKNYQHIHDAFVEYEGRMLLLGEPGSGKTTTLMAFARDKVAQRLEDSTRPLPILAPIATWHPLQQGNIADWLGQVIPPLKEEMNTLLQQGKLLLLLDGLDELGEVILADPDEEDEQRLDPRVLFLDLLPTKNQIVLSCRVKDYRAIGVLAKLNGAVVLQALNDAQLKNYLRDLPDLWQILQSDSNLRELARTPLLLSLFAYAFAGLSEAATELDVLESGDLRDRIFETYINRRYEHERRKRAAVAQHKLDDLMNSLGQIAVENIGTAAHEQNIIHSDEVSQETAHQQLLALAADLDILVPIDDTTFRFVHMLLRDFLAFRYAMAHLNDRYWAARAASATALGQLKDPRALPALLDALGDSDWRARVRIAGALINFGDAVLDVLLSNLKSSDPILRQISAFALGRIGNPSVIPSLVQLLNDTTPVLSQRVCDYAADALKVIGTPEALEQIEGWTDEQLSLLIEKLGDPDPAIRKDAAAELGKRRDRRAVEALIKTLGDQEPQVRSHAIYALGKLGDPRAVEPLIKLLSDTAASDDSRVCDDAAFTLRRLGTPESRAAYDDWKASQ